MVLESLEDRTLLNATALGAGLPAASALQTLTLGYSALVGGSGTEQLSGLALDSAGNAYIVGQTDSITFPGTNQTNAGGYDAFVSKISSSGELLWSRLIGGSDDDFGYGIALDSSGGVYITGETNSTNLPGTDHTNPDGNAVFVSKLSSDGELLWSTLAGDLAAGQSIAVATSGDIYITGVQSTHSFVSKLSSSGAVIWSTSIGDSESDSEEGSDVIANRIAVDSSGNAYITGSTTSPTFPGTDNTNSGSEDAFVSKLNADGELLWSTLLGGSGYDAGQGLAVDSAGNLYITGTTDSTDFPKAEPIDDENLNAFVSKLSADGELLWSTLLGGSSSSHGQDITVDSTGNLYVTGTTSSPTFPGTDQSNTGDSDVFVSKLSASGELLWSTLRGGSSFNSGVGIALDASGNLYVAGQTESHDFPGPNGATLSSSGVDAFLFQLRTQDVAVNPAPVLTSLSQTSLPAGSEEVTLTIDGNGFLPNSVVQWDGIALTTTYLSATRLTALVPATHLAQAGGARITIVNPAPGGGASNALAFTVTEPEPPIDDPDDPGSPTDQPTSPGTPSPIAGATASQEWNNLSGFYHLLCYQYFAKQGLNSFSSFTWGGIFAQYNVNLGMVKGASPLVSLIVFNHFLSHGGDPYSSGIVATTLTGQESTFMPASGSPSERVDLYYQSFGLPPDALSVLYAHALDLGHPDDAIAALIAAQHGARLV